MISRIRKKCEAKLPKEKRELYEEDFYRFFHEYDKRKKKNFLKTFPSLKALFKRGRLLALKTERKWRLEIEHKDPDRSYKAYRELMRIAPNSLKNKKALVTGPFWGEALEKKDILKINALDRTLIIFLSKALLNPERSRDVFYTLSIRKKELKSCLISSLSYFDKTSWTHFYSWQELALLFRIPKNQWSEICLSLCKKILRKKDPILTEHFLASLLSYPKIDPNLKGLLAKRERPYSSWIFRKNYPTKRFLNAVFSSKHKIMASRFDDFLKSFPPSKAIVSSLWTLALDHRDKLGAVTKALRPWKNSIHYLPQNILKGDHFVHAHMIKALGLEKNGLDCFVEEFYL